MNTEDALERIVHALEGIALAEKRIADHLDKQNTAQDSFRDLIESLGTAEYVTGSSNSSADLPVDVQIADNEGMAPVEPPRILDYKNDWYIETNGPERKVLVRLSDGTVREPTSEEASKLK
jgi:hypothetical protein